MNYYNYFDKMERKNNNHNQNKWMLYTSLAIMIGCIAVYSFFLVSNLNLEYRIQFLEEIQGNPLLNQKHQMVMQLEETIANVEEENEFVERVDLSIEQLDTANLELLMLLDEALQGVGHITKIHVEHNKIELEVFTGDLESNIKLQENLRNSGKFSDILIVKTKREFVGGEESNLVPLEAFTRTVDDYLINEITLTLKEGAIE